MRQLTLNFEGYAPMSSTAASVAAEAAHEVRTITKRVADQAAQVYGAAAAGVRKLAPALLPVGFVLATGADTIPQALASLACFAIGSWPLGVFNLSKEGGAA